MRFFLAILTIVIASAVLGDAEAAQITLRSSAEVAGPVVRLGDVAAVVSTDAKEKYQLENIELFPVPSQGQKRYIRQREIQDLLTLSGISLARHRFSGASSVTVYGEQESRQESDTPISSASGRRAKKKADDAILDYLTERADPEKPMPWEVDTQLDDAQIRSILLPGTRTLVSNAEKIQPGTCRFLLEIRSLKGESEHIEVDARLSLPNAIVATTRRLPRGFVIRASDVELIYEDTTTSNRIQGFYSISDVVGKELTQSLGPGSVIPVDMVRAPIVVKKGEVVTVISRAAGIAVSTNARAQEDGGLGELIAVESLENREVYFAKVTGLRELEVFAGAVQVQPSNEARGYFTNRQPGNRQPISLQISKTPAVRRR